MTTIKPLETYYAIFCPGDAPGSGDFLRSDAGKTVTAVGPIEKLPAGSRAVFLFSSKQRAEAAISRHGLSDEWMPAALGKQHTKIMLTEGRGAGLHQYVIFNPGEVLVDIENIDAFVERMPRITAANSEPEP
jgi:hypothetical protein